MAGRIDDIADGNDEFIKRFNKQAQSEEEAKVTEIGNSKHKPKRKYKRRHQNQNQQQQQQSKSESQSDDDEAEDKVKPKQYTVFKYSKDGLLAEEVTVGGLNVFLQIVDNKAVTSENIDLTEYGKNIILKPHELGEGSPLFPYSFANVEEINRFIKQAQLETIDSLFIKHKTIWKKIVAANSKIIGLLAVDSLYSYFQDKFSTTHYDMFIGRPQSGKGAILLGFKYLGYRVVVASDMSGANLLDLLGSIESCQITLVEDELDDIHEDPDKLRITKVGYDITNVTPRTLDGNASNRSSRYFYPYCLIYAAEESPDAKKLEGFNDRMFKHNMKRGKPQIYVKKLSEQTDNETYNDVKRKIDYLRKLTLVYRLIHHADIIEQVNTNLENRALELTEPQLPPYPPKTTKFPSQRSRMTIRKNKKNPLRLLLTSKATIGLKVLGLEIYPRTNE